MDLQEKRIVVARKIIESVKFRALGPAERKIIIERLLQNGLDRGDLAAILHQSKEKSMNSTVVRPRIVTLNLGYNIMANLAAGSEKPLVEFCRQNFNPGTKFAGWEDSSKEISACSQNSARFLLDYDLFALQEVNEKYRGKFEEYIRNRGEELKGPNLFGGKFKDYVLETTHYFGNFGITTGYDRNVMGDGIRITPDKFLIYDDSQPVGETGKKEKITDVRAMHALWFPKPRLLFINVHAPHKINLKRVLEERCRAIATWFKQKVGEIGLIDRVIIAGDFNDDSGSLLKTDINAFGKVISIPGHKVVKSCCADTGYRYPGDYILDSKSDQIKYYGLPANYNRQHDIYSDHDPVVLL